MLPKSDNDLQSYLSVLPFFTTLGETESWYEAAQTLKRRYKEFLICGLGGSILTARALLPLAGDTSHIKILDGIDPLTLHRLQQQDLSDTGIIFISKSGSTSEILCQVEALQPKEAVVITEIKDSP